MADVFHDTFRLRDMSDYGPSQIMYSLASGQE